MAMVEELKRRRVRMRTSQSEIARQLGCTPAAVSRWESGKNQVSTSDAERYAQAVGCAFVLRDLAAPDVEPLLERVARALEQLPPVLRDLVVSQVESAAEWARTSSGLLVDGSTARGDR